MLILYRITGGVSSGSCCCCWEMENELLLATSMSDISISRAVSRQLFSSEQLSWTACSCGLACTSSSSCAKAGSTKLLRMGSRIVYSNPIIDFSRMSKSFFPCFFPNLFLFSYVCPDYLCIFPSWNLFIFFPSFLLFLLSLKAWIFPPFFYCWFFPP